MLIIEHRAPRYHENQCQFGSGSQRGRDGRSDDGVCIVCGGRMMPVRTDVLAASSST